MSEEEEKTGTFSTSSAKSEKFKRLIIAAISAIGGMLVAAGYIDCPECKECPAAEEATKADAPAEEAKKADAPAEKPTEADEPAAE